MNHVDCNIQPDSIEYDIATFGIGQSVPSFRLAGIFHKTNSSFPSLDDNWSDESEQVSQSSRVGPLLERLSETPLFPESKATVRRSFKSDASGKPPSCLRSHRISFPFRRTLYRKGMYIQSEHKKKKNGKNKKKRTTRSRAKDNEAAQVEGFFGIPRFLYGACRSILPAPNQDVQNRAAYNHTHT